MAKSAVSLAATLLATLVVGMPAQAAPGMVVGTADDATLLPDTVAATTELSLAQAAGFRAVRLTVIWAPGQTAPEKGALQGLESAIFAADLSGVRVLLQVRPWSGRTAPGSPLERMQFASYAATLARRFPSVRDVIVGNEPNSNRFWLPQFDSDGRSVAPAAYLALLAACYDALKGVDPAINVIGGALSSRGADNPYAVRQTHSPGRFIRELGRAYRRSGRKLPVMDLFAHHPYGDHSSQRPEFRHRASSAAIGLGDYDKLARLLGWAFQGTAQPSWTLPIVYDEYGIDSKIPIARRALYAGEELAVTRPVPEDVQGRYYRRAITLAACQPRIRMFLIFHVSDEANLAAWQSGVYYTDGEPKASLPIVANAINAVDANALGACRPARPPREDRPSTRPG